MKSILILINVDIDEEHRTGSRRDPRSTRIARPHRGAGHLHIPLISNILSKLLEQQKNNDDDDNKPFRFRITVDKRTTHKCQVTLIVLNENKKLNHKH